MKNEIWKWVIFYLSYLIFPFEKESTYIIGGALLAFTVSFDEIVISYFLTGTWTTLPVYIYGMLRFGLAPKVYAISTIILLMSLVLITLMARYMGRSGETYRVRKKSKT
jgi:spermidine/putrescine transport system permease protein